MKDLKDLRVNIGDIEHFQELLNKMEDSFAVMYKNGKSGIYTITKESGNNQKFYQDGFSFTGHSYGIVKGLGMRLKNATKWFNTSVVEDFKWTSDTAGEFKTINSVYKFTFEPDAEEQKEDNGDISNEGSAG
jgi:hypothetical protein